MVLVIMAHKVVEYYKMVVDYMYFSELMFFMDFCDLFENICTHFVYMVPIIFVPYKYE